MASASSTAIIIIIIIDLIKDYRNINLHLDLVLWTYCSVVLLIDFGISFGLVDEIRGEGGYIHIKRRKT